MVGLAASLGACGVTFLQMLPLGAGRAMKDRMLADAAAIAVVRSLTIPDGMLVRLRTRQAAAGFTVRVWRNAEGALAIGGLRPLASPGDLRLIGRDGSA